MLSLKKTIDGLDREQQRFETARQCYLAALSSLEQNAVEVSEDVVHDFRQQLQALHRELGEDSSIPSLERSRGVLSEALQDYKKRSSQSLLRKEDDLRGILDVLGTAAETLGGHNDAHSSRLKEFTAQLQIVARGTDLAKMRLELTKRVEELRATTDAMWRDNHSSVAGMQAQLSEFQKRLERAESRAMTDSLTGLMNRGEGEDRLQRSLEDGKVISVILIDLNGFKQVNDRWGHSAGDQVLKTFAHVLRDSVRPSDLVCRWGGDEFLILLTCNEEIARQRADQLRSKLKITAKLVVLGKVIAVDVGAALGVAQARAGEPMEDLLTRADLELYGRKRHGKSVPPAPPA